ncbi:MAG: universal stress protein [Spirochaetales bacterium]|jgi:hypothetical protein|nr:universal stress protein [Spirochaetales bacterium]
MAEHCGHRLTFDGRSRERGFARSLSAGYPAEEIIKEAESANADLIVIRSYGRSALAAAFLGSVT